ncbi:MAG: hypothetical protein AAFX10_14710 [Pseudomonadota bacterium]
MFDSPILRAVTLAGLAALTLSSCGKKDAQPSTSALTSPDSVLAHVPADTPYLLASGAPFPDDLLDKLEPATDQMLRAYQTVVREIIVAAFEEYAETDEAADEEVDPEKAAAVFNEFASLLSIEGLREIGVTRDTEFAMYGVGLWPVTRIEVSDPKLFEDAIGRIEAAADTKMEVAEIDGNAYRYVGEEGADEGKLVVGIFENDVVITFVPNSFGDAELEKIFGLDGPAESIASTGRLAEMTREYGLTPHISGFFDTVGMVSMFIDEPSGLNALMFEASDYDAADLSDVCRAEIREMANVAPLVVFGYSEVTEENFRGKMLVRLRDDLAAAMTGLASVVPGLGIDTGALASFGMSVDLEAARGFYEDRLDAMESDPYECEYFQELQAGVAEGRMALQQPIPPIVYGLRGLNVSIDDAADLDFASDEPPEDVDASVLIAVDDAPSLVAMGAMFSPELAALNLQPDGKPVPLDLGQYGVVTEGAFAALSDQALVVSVGEDAEARATTALGAESTSPPLSMGVTMNASVYYAMMAESMMDADSDELSYEARAAMRDGMLAISEIFDRMTFDIRFVEKGLEIESNTTLKD